MPRNTVATAFFAGVILLALGLYIAADRGAAAASAPYVSTLGFAIAAGSVYLAGIYFLPRPSIRPLNVEWRRIIYWTMFGSMIAASIAFVAYTPTSASLELVKQFVDPSYQSTTDSLSIRLSTALMPLWAQALFDISRRVAAVYCIVEFFYSDMFPRHRFVIGAALAAVLAFFVTSTLDRLVPVLYLSTAIIASLATMKWRAMIRPANGPAFAIAHRYFLYRDGGACGCVGFGLERIGMLFGICSTPLAPQPSVSSCRPSRWSSTKPHTCTGAQRAYSRFSGSVDTLTHWNRGS